MASLLINLIMKRAIGIMVLLAFALALPCANLCAVADYDGQTISSLNICSLDSPSTSGPAITLLEPAYDIQAFLKVSALTVEKPLIYESTELSPVVKPPIA